MNMIHAGDINEMRVGRVRFAHNGTVLEGCVQWIADNDGILNPDPMNPGCVSLVLSGGIVINDLPKDTPVEKTY